MFGAWIACAIPLAGQQMPVFNIYASQPKYYNPAAQGGPSGGGVGVAYRAQFSDLPAESRPTSYLLQADVSPFISDRIGLGILAMQDNVHISKRTNVTAFFGYHLFPAENSFRLSLGAMAGILNERLDLGTATVNNPFDLTLLQSTESKTQFDGGLGVQAIYQTDEAGSGLELNLVLPQLFTSDVRLRPDGAERDVRYDMLPHVLTTLSYRWQAEAFALEPHVAYRESFGQTLKAGKIDAGLRAYFLPDNMLMVGAAYRTDEGGLQFSVGVKPISQVLISGAYETHSSLGGTFEVGARYLFGGPEHEKGPCVPTSEEQGMETARVSAEAARQEASSLAANAATIIQSGQAALAEAQAATSFRVQQEKLTLADQKIGEAEQQLTKIKTATQKALAAQTEANRRLNELNAAGHELCNTALPGQIQATVEQARRHDGETSNRLNELKNSRRAIVILVNPGDPASLQAFLSNALSKQPADGKPDEIKLVRVTATTIEFQYPDAAEAYTMTALPRVRSFVDFLTVQLADLKKEGLTIESARISGELQYSAVDTKVGAKYLGELGEPMKVNYTLNGKSKSPSIKKETTLTLETLGVAKIAALRRYLSEKTGLPESKITLEIKSPNPNNEYSQMTRLVLTYKKQ